MKNGRGKSPTKRKVGLHIHFSEFDLPPMQDVLLVGRRAPIGPEAVRRMVEALAPGQYEVILIDHTHIEAVAVKTTLFNWISRDELVNTLVEEGDTISNENSLIKAQLDVTMSIFKEVELYNV